jgi:hypothetical protein
VSILCRRLGGRPSVMSQNDASTGRCCFVHVISSTALRFPGSAADDCQVMQATKNSSLDSKLEFWPISRPEATGLII